MPATVQQLIFMLNDIGSEGSRDMARKLRKFDYSQQELDLIERQILVLKNKKEEKRGS